MDGYRGGRALVLQQTVIMKRRKIADKKCLFSLFPFLAPAWGGRDSFFFSCAVEGRRAKASLFLITTFLLTKGKIKQH